MIPGEKAQAPLVDPTVQAFSQLVTTARADTVFGQPVERGDTTVIPCSEFAIGMGMGSGSGPVDEKGNATGSGSGGGGAVATARSPAILGLDGCSGNPVGDPGRR